MTDVSFSGPMFDGRAAREVARGVQLSEQAIAEDAHAIVQANMRGSFKQPTGRYWSHVVVQTTVGAHEVTDQGIVYGPWLEGTGSRNRTTRFKGYASFRRAAQAANARAELIARQVLQPILERIG